MKSNKELIQAIKSGYAFKITDVADLGDSILPIEKFDSFVEEMEAPTSILNEARYITMNSYQTDFDRIAFDGDLKPGRSNGEIVSSETNSIDPEFSTATLTANEYIAETSMTYDSLEDNIERGNLEGRIVSMFGNLAGRSFERIAVFSDPTKTSLPAQYKVEAGFIAKAGHKLYGTGTDKDFDGTKVIDTLEATLSALPKKYLIDRSSMRFYVPYAIENAYRNELSNRESGLGDQAITGSTQLTYKGIPVVHAPVLDMAYSVNGLNPAVILTNPDNLVWGVYRQVQIEPDKDVRNRKYVFVLSMRGGYTVDNPNAVAVAFPTATKP